MTKSILSSGLAEKHSQKKLAVFNTKIVLLKHNAGKSSEHLADFCGVGKTQLQNKFQRVKLWNYLITAE